MLIVAITSIPRPPNLLVVLISFLKTDWSVCLELIKKAITAFLFAGRVPTDGRSIPTDWSVCNP